MSFYLPVCGSITPNIGGSITAVSDSEWAEYRQRHAIPALHAYTLTDFEEFFNERRKLLLERLKLALG